MLRALLTAVLLAAPSLGAARPPVVVEPWTDPRPAARGDALMRSTMIAAHSHARRRAHLPGLEWNEALARNAQVYARTLARSGRFQHDPQRGRVPREGENLWMGTRNAYRYHDMIGSLVDERRFFRPGRFPDVSRSGNWSDVGHYTQIIWPTTTHFGCAVASNARDDYLVCRYTPAGNIVGVTMR